MEWFVYQTRAENQPREDGSAAHRPPEGRAGHQAVGEETDSGDSFVYLGGAVCGDGKTEREVRRRAQAGTNARRVVEGVMAGLQKSKGQGHEHLCDTGMPVRNGNLVNDRTTTTKAASVRKQLGTKNSKSNEGRQAKNGGVKGRDRSQRSSTERLVRSRL